MRRRSSWPMERPSRRILVVVLVAVVAVAAFVIYWVAGSSGGSSDGVRSDVAQTIPSSGAKLSAEVVTPRASGRAPLLIMPGGWGQPATEYRAIARAFATQGYVVVGYAQRGFAASTGSVDFAGSATQKDVSTVITWALAHTAADPQRIGLMGISYGAGVSLLAAAHDHRVKAVAAFSTWADVSEALDPQGTPSTGALRSLIGPSRAKTHFAPVVKSLQHTLVTKPKELGPALRAIAKTRSPDTYVKQLNANRPAIMLANGFEDSIYAPAQLMSFFTALTTPKRLELAPGDHGGPELSGLLGQPNSTVDDASAWLNHYLRGTANGIEAEGPIVFKDVQTGALRSFSTWPKAPAKERVQLGVPGSADQTGLQAATKWQVRLTAGTDSVASSGHSQLVPSTAFVPATSPIASLNTKTAFVWIGPRATTAVALNGVPTVSLSIKSSSGTATVYVHLYDVGPTGKGSLIDFQPYTVAASSLRAVTITMQPISWTVPNGHRLGVVIDTVDQRYQSLTPKGATITVASTAKQHATFTAPSSS